ncbi:hypothetical protein [Algibacter mikhailovii]|uniref:hypothetical protein n=1 Tax=Algibacter mikhailovii TaxID=425498 RepID=UPI00249457B8|nr:hypothetical protein [Algibacter mikhailovii]
MNTVYTRKGFPFSLLERIQLLGMQLLVRKSAHFHGMKSFIVKPRSKKKVVYLLKIFKNSSGYTQEYAITSVVK